MVCANCAVVVAGYALIAAVAYRLLSSIYNILYPYFIATPLDLHEAAGGKWAVVTGATDGIGRAYASQLATRKFNLLIISRSLEKLNKMREEFESAFGIQVKVLAFDFTTADAKQYENVMAARLAEIDVGVLVNNVGLSYEYPEVLHKVEGGLQRLTDIAVINTVPPTLMTSLILKQMVERNRGVVINIGSSAANSTMAMWGVYSASKKYVQWLSAILRLEYASYRILIQTVFPMLVATKMSKIKQRSFFGPNPEEFAASAIRTVGIVPETTGYFSHQMQLEMMNWMPAFIVNPFLTKESIKIRERALRKKAREEADK